MSDIIAPPVASPLITLVIRFDPRTNKIDIDGPIDNKILAYGMLQVAHDAIDAHSRQKEADQRVIPVSLVPGN